MADQETSQQPATTHSVGMAKYMIAIIVNLIMLYIFNNLLRWQVSFITADFVLVLPILNLSLVATMIANTIFLAYDPKWFVNFIQIILDGIALGVTYTIYRIFPFNFSMVKSINLDPVVKVALFLMIIGTFVAMLVEAGRLVYGAQHS